MWVLVSRIDKDRQNKNLSSAIRVFVLDHYRQTVSAHPHEPGPPMTLGSLRQLGVRGLLLICLDLKCRHEPTMSVDDYADEIELLRLCRAWYASSAGEK
jgi:hypothetical protein